MFKNEKNSNGISFNFILGLVLVGILLITNPGCKNDRQRIEKFFNVKNEVSLPEETGKDFSPQLDYERITDSITKVNSNNNPQDYQEFSQSVKEIHEEILTYLSRSLNLPEKTRDEVLKQYRDYHDTFAHDYYNQLAEQKNVTLPAETQSYITYNTIISAQHFTNLLSANICNLAGFIITLTTSQSLETSPIGLFLGKSCQAILSLLLKPIAEKIKQAAVIKDFTESKVSLQKHIRNMIIELGTIKDSFVTDIDEHYKLELFFGIKSEAHLCVHARSTIKAGFKLHRYFKLKFNHTNKEILMTLPEPEILSNQIDTQIVDMDNGLLVKIDKRKLNEVSYKVKKWGIKTAIKSGILDNAKKNVHLILKTIFQPIILATDPGYKIRINYKSLPGQKNRIESNSADQTEISKHLTTQYFKNKRLAKLQNN